jgi:hypothetical protein
MSEDCALIDELLGEPGDAEVFTKVHWRRRPVGRQPTRQQQLPVAVQQWGACC